MDVPYEPRLRPLEQWFCDDCGAIIDGAEQGWVEWLTSPSDDSFMNHGFRLIHKKWVSARRGGCSLYESKYSNFSDTDLSDFLNSGPLYMVIFIDPGRLHQPEFRGHRVKDFREWSEFFRRLYIPYYEEARFVLDYADEDGYFFGDTEVGAYRPEKLLGAIQRYGPGT